MRHRYQCPLRWSDMDAYGHVNNVVFLRYLEEARIDLLFRLASEEGGNSLASGTVVARNEIDYLRPLVYRPEPVTVEVWVTRISGASATLAYEIRDEETVYARAATVIVPYLLDEGRPRRLTAEEKTFLEGYRDGQPGDSAEAVAA